MNTYLSNRNVCSILQELETKYDLLKYEIDGWCIWPKIRWHIFRQLQNRPDDIKINQYLEKRELIKIGWSDLKNILRCRGRMILVQTQQSYINENVKGLQKDLYFDDLICEFGTSIKNEQVVNYDLWKQRRVLIKTDFTTFFIDTLIDQFSRRIKINTINNVAHDIYSILTKEINPLSLSFEKLEALIYDFYWGKKVYKYLLSYLKPKIFLIADTNQTKQIAASKELGIKIIEFQHGFIDKFHQGYSWNSYAVPYKHKMPIPDKLFLYGKYWTDEMKSTGFWSDELISTGSIKMDTYRSKIHNLDKTPGLLKLLLTTQGFDTIRLIEFMYRFLKLAKKRLQLSLSIKLHPYYDSSYDMWVSRFSEFENVEIFHGHEEPSTFELLSETDFHMTIWSTTHFDAIGLGKKTIVLPLSGWKNVKSLIEQGYAFFVESPMELINLLKRNEDIRYDSKVSRNFYKNNAVENIIDAIKEQVRWTN